MTAITIRNVPEDVRDELAARAARSGRSLQEYLVAQLGELALRPDPSAVLDRIRSRKTLTSSTLDASAILALRDVDRA